MTNTFEIERLLTAIESDPETIHADFDPGTLAGNLYLELLESWDSIPEKPRAVMAFVGAILKQQHYRELQAEIEAMVLARRLARGK